MSSPPGTWGRRVLALKYQNRALTSTQKRGRRTGMLLICQNKILFQKNQYIIKSIFTGILLEMKIKGSASLD